MIPIKKIIASVVLVFLTLIIIAIIFGSSNYTDQTVNNKEITTSTTIQTSIVETTYRIKTTIPTTILTSTTTEQLKGVIQTETNSGCEALGCPSGTMFVGSKTSKKYHNCDCTWAKKISSSNLVCFKTIEEVQNSGYIPCKVCKPQ